MPSPFPGMNPYLEHEYVWRDFQLRSIPVMSELLLAHLDERYSVMLEEHLYIHEPTADERRLFGHADVSVASKDQASSPGIRGGLRARR